MSAPTITTIETAVESATALYHRAVFLVGSTSDSRSELLATIAAKHNWTVVNLGLLLSQQLLDVPRRHRAVSAPQVLADLLEAVAGDVLLLDHIEILFLPDLAQDAVKLLQSLSRNRTLVILWPGTSAGGTLSYAEPGHPEYYKQPVAGLMLVEMSGGAAAPQT